MERRWNGGTTGVLAHRAGGTNAKRVPRKLLPPHEPRKHPTSNIQQRTSKGRARNTYWLLAVGRFGEVTTARLRKARGRDLGHSGGGASFGLLCRFPRSRGPLCEFGQERREPLLLSVGRRGSLLPGRAAGQSVPSPTAVSGRYNSDTNLLL